MKLLLELLVVGALAWQIDALRCRRCIGASNLDECTFSVPCSKDEICYMDEVITEQYSIEYNGGCRPRDICLKGPAGLGRKRAGPLVACSKCCDIDNGHNPECNTKLCGLKASTVNISQCYHCGSDPTGGSAVSDPDQCTLLTTCQSDEVCGAESFRLSGNENFEFACLNRRLCTLLTQESLKRLHECRGPNAGNTQACGLTGKRNTPGQKVCSACCGDALCNSGTCQDVLDRLYNLWQGKVLDFQTLKTNGTLPKVTTTMPSVPLPGGVTVSGSG